MGHANTKFSIVPRPNTVLNRSHQPKYTLKAEIAFISATGTQC